MAVRSMVELLAKDKKVKKPWPWPDNYTLKLEEFITGIINKESAAIYSGGESITFSNGLILKQGTATVNITPVDVTFAVAFPTAIDNAWCQNTVAAVGEPVAVTAQTTTKITMDRDGGSGSQTVNWFAIGN